MGTCHPMKPSHWAVPTVCEGMRKGVWAQADTLWRALQSSGEAACMHKLGLAGLWACRLALYLTNSVGRPKAHLLRTGLHSYCAYWYAAGAR